MSTKYISGCSELANDICKALGFTDVVSLQLNIAVKEAVRVTVTKFVTFEEAKLLAQVLAKYEIEATQIELPSEEPR